MVVVCVSVRVRGCVGRYVYVRISTVMSVLLLLLFRPFCISIVTVECVVHFNMFISGPFGSTYPTSACEHSHTQ